MTYLIPQRARMFFNGIMDEFERLYERWQVAHLCLWTYMAGPDAASPFVREFLLAQLREVTGELQRALWFCVRERQRALPLL